MTANLTPGEVGILVVQFSVLPNAERPNFLRQHPEIRSAAVVDWALTAARLRGQMGEPEAKTRLAKAALYIATELGDFKRQLQAHEMLVEGAVQDREPKTLHPTPVVSEELSPHGEQLPSRVETWYDPLSSARGNTFTFEVFNILTAVASAGSEATARRVVNSQIRLALHSEFLPVLMQVQDQLSQLADPLPYLDAFSALILDEVNRSLAEMEPEAVGRGGACTALILADTPQVIEAAIARYQPLIDDTFFDELERMSVSFAERDLPRFATLARMLVDLIRQQMSRFDKEPVPPDLDAQTLALLRVSLATTVEEARAAVEEEPGLLSENAVQPIREQLAYREMIGDLTVARRLRQVVDWLTRWRSELADPEHNIVSRLAERIRAGELTLEVALAELEGPDALAGLSGPHLGAVDEQVIALRMRDLRQAEILAALNDAAAWRVGSAKIRAYTAISLAELRISRGAAEEALQAFNEALEQAQQAADPRLELRLLGTQGLAYQQLGRLREAAAYYRDALDLARRMESEADQMPSLNSLGYIYNVLGETEQALTYLWEGYEIALRLGDRPSEANFLVTMAALSQQTGRFRDAIEQLTQAITIFRHVKDRDNKARALSNLGEAYVDLGELENARKAIEESLALAQSLGMRSVEGNAWSSLGRAELLRGHLQQAIKHFQQSRTIAVKMGDRRAEGNAENNLGLIYIRLNLRDRAEHHLEHARDIARQIGDRRLEGLTSLNLGNNYGSRGLWILATDRYQVTLNIAQKIGDRHLETQALGSLGRAYEHQGYFQAALNEYERVLKLQREIGDRQGEALTLNNIANSYAGLCHFEQALVKYDEALVIARDLTNPDMIARILTGRARAYTHLGRYTNACADYRESINLIETFRGGLVEEEHRMSYFGWDKIGVYRSLVLLLADHNRCWQPPEGLEMVERSKSRAFLDQLGTTELSVSPKVDIGLLSRERELAAELQGKALAMRQAKSEAQRQELVTQITRLQAEWNVVLDQIAEQAPEYVALRRGKPAGWEEIQAFIQLVED